MTEHSLTYAGSAPTKAAVAADLARYAPEICEDLPPAVALLLTALAQHDAAGYLHSLRVARAARELAQALGADDEQIVRAFVGGLLHDVGKIHLPRTLLHKHEPLTCAEWAKIQRHPLLGAQMLKLYPEIASLAPIVAAHHERPDGAGYPCGLTKPDIPAEALLIAVVDAIDRMRYRRHGSAALTSEHICRQLIAGAGTSWDQRIAGIAAQELARAKELLLPSRTHSYQSRQPSQLLIQKP